MGKKRLLWQLYPSYLLITFLSVLVVAWYASRSQEAFYFEQLTSDLEARGEFARSRFKPLLADGNEEPIRNLCVELGRETSTRITIILPGGRVVADSEENPAKMDNHADRPEVIEALAGGRGASRRFSHTLQQEMMYVALPLSENGAVTAIVRTAVPATPIEQALRNVHWRIAAGGLIVALAGAAVSFFVARRISRPLEQMERGAERFARGEFEPKLSVPSSEELGGLALALNRMATDLDERIRRAVRERNEHEAVLASMNEGVLAIDSEERIISMNRAAARLFEVGEEIWRGGKVQGRNIQEVIRNTDLQQFVKRTLAGGDNIEGEIVLHGEAPRFLQAHGSVLLDAEGSGIGALVVLNDVTRLIKLENVRREFVANVSHEMKTPITSIKGFVETLLEGAIDHPDEARRFLGIVQTHADRLHAIIEDLLSLSRIELEAERNVIILEPGSIREVLQAAIEICQVHARAKGINITLNCPADLRARINAALLEQAVVNLIDNAVKYSGDGKDIQVEAEAATSETVIRVRDHGCGIDAEHLSRLFERFYRVDKARSRKAGGTGLGLAITKHIAQAHGGSVGVESVLGEGSIFSIRLPKV